MLTESAERLHIILVLLRRRHLPDERAERRGHAAAAADPLVLRGVVIAMLLVDWPAADNATHAGFDAGRIRLRLGSAGKFPIPIEAPLGRAQHVFDLPAAGG